MNADDLKERYGEEYPAAVVFEGVRMPLKRETRFSRIYFSKKQKREFWVSRYMDGSASITAEELQREWPDWTDRERVDFCHQSSWLHEQADFPEMLRFIMSHGDSADWSGIALSIAGHLPKQEAFDFLVEVLRSAKIEETANIAQGIAYTKHPGAKAVLRKRLQDLWAHPSIWNDDKVFNDVATNAMHSIQYLIELGEDPIEFTERVRQLSKHVCPFNRDVCRNFLFKYYPWLGGPADPSADDAS